MPCYSPLKGWRGRVPGPSGKLPVVFSPQAGYQDRPIEVPCGQCIGCRLERSRQWAIRCVHEAQMHDQNCFITLTYSPEYVPADFSLDVREWQLFMKRLRKRFSGRTIRFFHCGEYGSRYGRPHYHACLFGFDFPDKRLWKETFAGSKLYRSEILEQLWPYGYSSIGDVTFESAAYVARYIMKKITGEQAEEHYKWMDPHTGELIDRKPEYTTMSRRPGIAHRWFEQYQSDVFPHDEVILRGKKMKPPKYYDTLYEVAFPEEAATIKAERVKSARRRKADNTPERLRVKEKVKKAQTKRLKRSVDDDS